MLKHHQLAATLVLMLAGDVLAGVVSASDLTMPGARMSIVGEKLSINGVPTSIYRFSINERPAEVQAFYKRQLGERVVERRGGNFITLGALHDTQFVTVKLDVSTIESTEGTVALADIGGAGPPPRLPSGVAMPMGSKLVFSTRSVDLGQASMLFVYVNRQTVVENVRALKELLARSGYSLRKEQPSTAPKSGHILIFQKNNGDVIASVTKSKGVTSLVLNFMSQGSGQ